MEIHPPLNVSYFYNGFRKYNIFIFIICFLCFSTELAFGQIKDSDKKFIICHHLPDNPDKTITLEVGLDDLQEHLDHGDTFGPCFDGDLNGDILPYFEPPEAKVEEEIGAALTSLVRQFEKLGSVPSDDIYIISGDRALIEIIAEDISSLSTIENNISSNYPDAVIYSDYGDANDDLIITVLFPINYLEDLNEDLYQENIVSFARPVYTPILKSGLVNSQGDIAIQSDNARKAFESVDGSGVKVCVLSDSYDAKQKAKADIDNKDLPFDIDISEDFPSDYGAHFYVVDEGRAMLQIIHDVAPGASLGFKTGFKGIEHMADGIQILNTEHGCNVMVDDVTHLAEPFFVDGLISKAVDKVSEEGVTYISSAGNFADWGHADQFYPANENETFHSFSHNGNIYQEVRFEKAGVYIIVLQWDDVYKSLGGINNLGAQNDLDISLVDNNGNTLVALNCKNTGGDPVEVMPIKVENAGALANLVIQKAPGNANVNFKYIVFVGGQDFTILSQSSSVSTIVGQANASKAYTVGAAFYDQSPALGVDLPTIELFSSHGGSLINGIDRNKPDFVGPDGVNTSVFSVGVDSEKDEDPFPNFLGTSAAAPHAAGIAALVWHAASIFDVPGIDPGETMKQTALDMYESGYDKMSGSGFLLADEAIISFASPKPTIIELIVPDNKIPGEKAFTATIIGENLTIHSQVLLNGNPLDAKLVKFIDRSTIAAKIPAFTSDALVQVYNPFITPSEFDGGYSNELSFFTLPKTKITVVADNEIKKFGEKNPDFTSSLFVNGIPLVESGLDPNEIDRLSEISFLYETASKEWDETEGQYCSPTGMYYIHPIGIHPDNLAVDQTILDDYDFDYAIDDKAGHITIEELPITIKPITKDSYVYGESFQNISFQYDLYSDDVENNDNIDNLELLLEYIQEEHQSTFREEITNAIVDRARQLVNRGRQLVNESGWLISDATISNRARQLVNGDIAIDLDIDLIIDYGINLNLDGTIPNRGRQLVNGELIFNKESYIKDELGNRVRQLVNEGAIGVNESDGEDFANITLIVDTTDATVTNIYSINLISGLDVNPADGNSEYEGALQYCVPGAFISPAADNFTITYASTDFDILPADLTVTADNKQMFLEDLVIPKFTSTFDGFQYEDNENKIFSNISYTPTEVSDIGEYDIIPANFEFFDEINYNIIPTEGVLTVQNIFNGQIVAATENIEGLFDLTLFNDDGSNPVTLVSAPGLVPGSVRDPDFSPNGEVIVFTSTDGDTFSDLWKVNSDGSGLTQLTIDGLSGLADFSPDGTQIAFIRDGDVAVMNTDGSYPKIIHETPEREWWPFYAPDGEELYFTRYTGEGINEIFKIDLDPAQSNLLHWWPADGNVFDIERGNYGSLQGGATFGPSQLSGAFQLDGIDGFVMVTDNPSLNFGTRDFTLELWVNFTNTDGEQVLVEKWIQKHDASSSGWTLTKLEDNTIRLALSQDNESEVGLDVTPPSLTIDTWYHIAVTREENNFTLFWNGLPLDNIECPYNLSSASSLKMGHRGNIYDTPGSQDERGFYLNGFIDEVKIYNRTLSSTEIQRSYAPAETQITTDNIFYRQPDFFRDGTKILSARADNSSSDSYDIMTMRPDGTEQTSIYSDLVGSATASPDNQKIAFTRESDQWKFLTVINPDGTYEQIIVEQEDMQLIQPNWGANPDGDKYVNISDPNFEQALIDLGIDSGGPVRDGRILRSDALAVTTLDVSDPENNENLPNVNAKILTLTGIEAFSNLTHLDCEYNQITTMDLTKNIALTSLVCQQNLLTSLDVSQNTALEWLMCGHNQITGLDVSQNTVLTSLYCDFNQITSLDVSHNTSLRNLHCWDNLITNIDLRQNLQLQYLNFRENQLTNLDVSQNTALRQLYCLRNQLTSLDVSQNTALYNLWCNGNQLTNLDVTKNTALVELICDFNELTSLNVSQNTSLNRLICRVNNLTELDLTKNTALTNLDCHYNELISLDLRNGNNSILTTMNASNNSLTCISVDDESVDHSIWEVDKDVIFSNDCDLLDRLIAYYPFDGNANDMSGNGHDGIVTGASLAADRFGTANSSYSFDGNDDKIHISDHSDFDFTDKVTISAWFKPDNSEYQYLVKKAPDSGGGGPYSLDYYYGTPRTVLYNESGDLLVNLEGSSLIQVGVWQHIAFTYDGSTVKLYYNGQFEASQAVTGALQQSNGNVDVGVYEWGDLYYEGIIDDIYFYNYAITDSEVESLYNEAGWPIAQGFASSSMQSSTIQGEITIYPNPVINNLTIVHEDENITNIEIAIINSLTSNTLFNDKLAITLDRFEVDLSWLATGVYILQINDGKTIEEFHIQKE